MKEQPALLLRQKRQILVKNLSRHKAAFLRGSLIERYKRCGKPACKCHQTGAIGHGPKYYLSNRISNSSPQMEYVPKSLYPQVQKYVKNYHLLKTTLEEICEINRELLRRREDF